MTLTAAYRCLNKLIWRGRLPHAVVLRAEEDILPRCYGITLFDDDFVRPVIFISHNQPRPAKTLVHEMLHVAEPTLPHGKIFDNLVERYWSYARKNIKGLGAL